MSTLLESRLSPQQRAEACAADAAEAAAEAAMRNLDANYGAYPSLLDVLIADADYGSYAAHPLDPRNSGADDNLTSLQPLGDATVMVVYSWDSNESLAIDGIMLGGELANIENFSNHVRGQWEKAIRAEECKAAEIGGWGE